MNVGRIDSQAVLVDDIDGRAEALEHFAHHVNVGDVRHILQDGLTGGKQRCGHELERRVLGTRDMDAPVEPMSALNANDVQARSLQ